MYYKRAYTTKADVFSIGVIYWEITARLLGGAYRRRYSEYPDLKMDFHIILKVATKRLRPTFDEICPSSVQRLIVQCWAQEPEDRLSCKEVMKAVLQLQKEYKKKKAKWKKALPLKGK